MAKNKKYLNPNFTKTNKTQYTVDELYKAITKGDRPVLAHALTLAESNRKDDRQMIAELLRKSKPTPETRRIGITGPPGAGKSTFIDSFGSYLGSHHNSIAILAIDPSSPQSGGSILGDKTRMERISNHENIFIRPTAAGNHLGGVSAATLESILLCEMAGYKYIFVETVGVGQSELEVSKLVDMLLVIVQHGAGDDLQGIKRGITELADLFIVNKYDGENKSSATKTAQQLAQATSLLRRRINEVAVDISLYSSVEKGHEEKIFENINEFFSIIETSDYKAVKRSEQIHWWFEKGIKNAGLSIIQNLDPIQKLTKELELKITESDILPIEAIGIFEDELYKLLH